MEHSLATRELNKSLLYSVCVGLTPTAGDAVGAQDSED